MPRHHNCPTCGNRIQIVAKQCRQCRSKYLRSTEHFWSLIRKLGPDNCWLWSGATNRDGYGRRGTGYGDNLAHRHAWKLTNGPIPPGLCVLHKCDNPLCCNPSHLFLGTHQDNHLDMVRKDRQVKGVRHGLTKLTAKLVEQIRHEYIPYKCSTPTLASKYDVSQSTIYRIIKRDVWK